MTLEVLVVEKDGVFRDRFSISDDVEKGHVGVGSRDTGE